MGRLGREEYQTEEGTVATGDMTATCESMIMMT